MRSADHGSPAVPPRAATIGLLAALTAFPSMSVDLYLPSLPTIARAFERPAAEASLTVVLFLLGLGVGQLVHGPLSDRYGRRAPLLAGIALYAIASLGCAFATSLGMLIVCRFVQALGGCAGVVIARAVVRDLWEGAEVARIFSLLMLVMGVAPLVAPLAGSGLLLLGGWRAIFGVLTGFALLMFAAVLLGLPESRTPAVAAQARSESPAGAYLALLGHRRLVGFLLAAGFSQAVLHSFIAISPDLLITSYGIAAHFYGPIFAANAVGMIVAAQINQRLLRRHDPIRLLRRANLVAICAAVVLLVMASSGAGSLPAMLAALFVMIASLGFSSPNALACAMAVDPRRSGSTAALVGAGQFGAGAACGAVAGLFYDGSAVSMAAVMLGALTIVFLAVRLAGTPGKD